MVEAITGLIGLITYLVTLEKLSDMAVSRGKSGGLWYFIGFFTTPFPSMIILKLCFKIKQERGFFERYIP